MPWTKMVPVEEAQEYLYKQKDCWHGNKQIKTILKTDLNAEYLLIYVDDVKYEDEWVPRGTEIEVEL